MRWLVIVLLVFGFVPLSRAMEKRELVSKHTELVRKSLTRKDQSEMVALEQASITKLPNDVIKMIALSLVCIGPLPKFYSDPDIYSYRDKIEFSRQSKEGAVRNLNALRSASQKFRIVFREQRFTGSIIQRFQEIFGPIKVFNLVVDLKSDAARRWITHSIVQDPRLRQLAMDWVWEKADEPLLLYGEKRLLRRLVKSRPNKAGEASGAQTVKERPILSADSIIEMLNYKISKAKQDLENEKFKSVIPIDFWHPDLYYRECVKQSLIVKIRRHNAFLTFMRKHR